MRHRLKRLAAVEDLGEKNMNQSILNQILLDNGEEMVVNEVLFREMLNDSTKYVVETWKTNTGEFAIFSGKHDGSWRIDNIEYNGKQNSESNALLYVQQNLQQEAGGFDILVAKSQIRLKKISKK